MATITGFTAGRMKEIEDTTIVDGDVINGQLILKQRDGTEINAGQVQGTQGIQGPVGPQASFAGYKEPIIDLGDVTGTVIINLSTNNVWRMNPIGAVSVVFTNLPDAGFISPGTLIIANANHAITWPSGTKFPRATPPEIEGETYISMVARSTHVTVGSAWVGVA